MSDLADRSRFGLVTDGRAEGATHVAAAGRNVRLQYLRALAAFAVTLYHASTYLKDLRGEARLSAVFSDVFGAGGVAVFFALSGYLMAEIIRREDWGKFLTARIARIYPPMLLMVALFAVVFLLSGQPRGFNALGLTLVPAGPRGYFLAVEWTLLYEMTYYVALTLLGLLGLARWGAAFALLWLAALAASWIWGAGRVDIATPTLSELPLLVINLPFVLGFLSAEAKRRGWLPPGLGIAAIVIAALVPLLPSDYLRLLSGIAASLLLAATLRQPRPGAIGPAGALLARFGDASYVLYLCHVPVFLLLHEALPGTWPAPAVWLAMVATALSLSLLLGPFDLALHDRLKRSIGRASRQRLRAVAVTYIAAFLAIGVYAEWDVRSDRADEAQARRILETAPTPGGASVRAAIDSASRLGDGRWVVRGYSVDLDRPTLATHIAIRQRGELVAIDRMRRMRAATARELGRADLESQRFGFAIILPVEFDCAKGRPDAVVIFEDGRAVPLAPGPMSAICG